MIRLGMLDLDTSHAVEFTKRLNHKGISRTQWVDGARVILACPGESRMAPDRVPGFTQEMKRLGVPLVAQPRDMIGAVDGMLIESLEGGVHLARAKPFLDAGIPCFIDKPFTCSVADAKKLAALAARNHVPVFSASSLRYAPELVAYQARIAPARVEGAVTYGPAPSYASPAGVPGNPGVFHYAIHAIEMLYTLMGPGCVRVSCFHERDVDVVTGRWQDGRVGTMRGMRPTAGYGFLAFAEGHARHVTIRTTNIYRELLRQVVQFFQQKQAPVDLAVTVEIMAFLEAAQRSASKGGREEKVVRGGGVGA